MPATPTRSPSAPVARPEMMAFSGRVNASKCAACSPLNGPRAPWLMSAPPREPLGRLSQMTGLATDVVRLNGISVLTKADVPKAVVLGAQSPAERKGVPVHKRPGAFTFGPGRQIPEEPV